MTSESRWLQRSILAFLLGELDAGALVVVRARPLPLVVILLGGGGASGPLVARPAFGEADVLYVAIGGDARHALVRLQQLALVTVTAAGR